MIPPKITKDYITLNDDSGHSIVIFTHHITHISVGKGQNSCNVHLSDGKSIFVQSSLENVRSAISSPVN